MPELRIPSPVEYAPSRDLQAAETLDFPPPEVDRCAAQLRLLWERRMFLAKAGLIGLAAGVLFAFLLPQRYVSTVKLMPPNTQSGQGAAMLAALSAKAGSAIPAVAGDLLGMGGPGALFVGILQSRTIQDRLVHHFDLQKVYGDRLEEDACRDLAQRTAVDEDRKSGIITITVTDRHPQTAAAIAQAYVEELDRLSAELSTSAAHRERVFLEERLRAVKLDLDAASKDFSQFASQNSTIDIKEQGRTMVEAAARLQGELIAARSQMKGLEEIYTPTNVRVREVEARVAELQTQLDKLGGTSGAETGPAEDGAYPSIRQLPLLGVRYADLYRRTQIQEAVYQTLTQQYELAKVQEAKETPSVKLLDPESVPQRKSFPPRFLLMYMLATVGLAIGATWITLQAHWEKIDGSNPRKVLAKDILRELQASLTGSVGPSESEHAVKQRIWARRFWRGNSSNFGA